MHVVGFWMLLYLRIDLIESAAGAILSGCEDVAPELFFRARLGSASRFTELIKLRGA